MDAALVAPGVALSVTLRVGSCGVITRRCLLLLFSEGTRRGVSGVLHRIVSGHAQCARWMAVVRCHFGSSAGSVTVPSGLRARRVVDESRSHSA